MQWLGNALVLNTLTTTHFSTNDPPSRSANCSLDLDCVLRESQKPDGGVHSLLETVVRQRREDCTVSCVMSIAPPLHLVIWWRPILGGTSLPSRSSLSTLLLDFFGSSRLHRRLWSAYSRLFRFDRSRLHRLQFGCRYTIASRSN